RGLKAFQRAREVGSAVDLLRLAFAYCLGHAGLRLTAAWAETVELASLSDGALLKRPRTEGARAGGARPRAWVEAWAGGRMGSGGPVEVAQARPTRIVGATMIAKAGREGRAG